MKAAAMALAVACAAAPAAWAEEQDFVPEFGVLEGAELTHFLVRDFDVFNLPVGQFTREAQPVEAIEGEIRELVYRLSDETSTLEAVRTYQERFAALGYDTVLDCAGTACGGFDFRFNTYLIEPPAMRFDLADFRALSVTSPSDGRRASVIATRQGGKLFVQVISVEGVKAPEVVTAAPPIPPRVKPGEAQVFALARRLTEEGHAPLDGVSFEAGSATLTLSSEVPLKQAAGLLRGRPDLVFLVVGHTDNQGGLEANMALSLERAKAVAAKLSEAGGVEATQLSPHGLGYLAPRATNATEEGRALNRRVELVIK